MKAKILVIGGGLAGSDCAWFLGQNGQQVTLCESKKISPTAAQKMPTHGELVCSNSLKSTNPHSAHGILKSEMQSLGPLVYQCAIKCRVPAGDALAVDRKQFSELVTQKLQEHPLITLIDQEVSDPLAVQKEGGHDFVVVDRDSLDLSVMYHKDRHKSHHQSADYLNVPLECSQYQEFVDQLKSAEKVLPQDFEDFRYFESCLPIDVMAERGEDTLRFSCMRPIGLECENGHLPYAAIQLRKENLLGNAYNLVSLQTKLTYPEQLRIFRTLPGFERAEFLRLGSIHRNTFIDSRKLLHSDFSTKAVSQLYFAGQITGVEGHTESAPTGLYVGLQILRKIKQMSPLHFPPETAIGALVNYLMTAKRPAPSNINFGLFPSVALSKEQRRSKQRKEIKKSLIASRAQKAMSELYQQWSLGSAGREREREGEGELIL